MHELPIAEAILDVVERRANGRQVLAVRVQVGADLAVHGDPLSFGFEVAAAGSVAEGATLELVQTFGADVVVEAIEYELPAGQAPGGESKGSVCA
jgi:Zn finger protein HypA/HybF involved in hydrogenase expression